MRIFSRIMSSNLWPLRHYADFGVDQASFQYAFATGVSIDFASHAIRLMLAVYGEGNSSLPFGGLVTWIFKHRSIEHRENGPTITPLGNYKKSTI